MAAASHRTTASDRGSVTPRHRHPARESRLLVGFGCAALTVAGLTPLAYLMAR